MTFLGIKKKESKCGGKGRALILGHFALNFEFYPDPNTFYLTLSRWQEAGFGSTIIGFTCQIGD